MSVECSQTPGQIPAAPHTLYRSCRDRRGRVRRPTGRILANRKHHAGPDTHRLRSVPYHNVRRPASCTHRAAGALHHEPAIVSAQGAGLDHSGNGAANRRMTRLLAVAGRRVQEGGRFLALTPGLAHARRHFPPGRQLKTHHHELPRQQLPGLVLPPHHGGQRFP